MTSIEYRTLIAYIMYWQDFMGGDVVNKAILELRVNKERDEVLNHFFERGYDFVDGKLKYNED